MPKTNTGGPQPGSGRPSGHGPERKAAQALSASLSTQPIGLAVDDLQPVSPAVEAVCKGLARGHHVGQVAKDTGLARQTVWRWSKRYRALISTYIDAMVDPKSAFRHLAGPTLDGYEQIIRNQDHPMRATILMNTADRIWDKPRIISESYSQASVTVSIISADSELGAQPDFRELDIGTDEPPSVGNLGGLSGGFAASPIPSDTESQ